MGQGNPGDCRGSLNAKNPMHLASLEKHCLGVAIKFVGVDMRRWGWCVSAPRPPYPLDTGRKVERIRYDSVEISGKFVQVYDDLGKIYYRIGIIKAFFKKGLEIVPLDCFV